VKEAEVARIQPAILNRGSCQLGVVEEAGRNGFASDRDPAGDVVAYGQAVLIPDLNPDSGEGLGHAR